MYYKKCLGMPYTVILKAYIKVTYVYLQYTYLYPDIVL